ncbi:MAG TPA: hypothetical protein VGF76_19905 [Polyangiaceae bacterium]
MSKINLLRRLALGAAATLATSATPASAAPAPPQLVVVLSYQVDPELHGCTGEAEFRDSVIKQLGYDPFRSEAAHRVVAELSETESGIEGRLAWADANGNPEGERRLSSLGQDCNGFLKSMAFAMAVQIQLMSSTESGSSSSAAAAAPVTPPPPRPAPVALATPAPAAVKPKWSLALGAGPIAELGVLPSLAEGFRLFAAARGSALSLELSPELTLPVTFRRADGTGFSASSYAATLVPCARRGRLGLCAVGMLGVLAVRGFGVDDARSPSSVLAKAGLRLAFDQPLAEHLALGAHADGLATLTPRTVLLNEVPVWTTPNLGLMVGIDLAVLLP